MLRVWIFFYACIFLRVYIKMFRSGYSQETIELSIVQILVLVARSLTEISLSQTEDDRSGERFHVAA